MGNIEDMLMFIAVADTSSFSRAGARLQTPKSTVSHRIAQLEKRLGLQLFSRTTRQVSLTSNGQVYLEHCRRICAEVAAATSSMADLKRQPIGRLRITCPEVTASFFMPTFLRGFTARYPGVVIDLLATNAHLDLVQERVDFAFRVGPVSHQEYIAQRLSTIRRILAASRQYLDQRDTPGRPDDLSRHRCLVHDAMPQWHFRSKETTAAITPKSAMRSDSIGFLYQSCRQGEGIALLPAYVCHSAIRAGELLELLPDWHIPAHEMTLVYARSKNESKTQQAFRDYSKNYDFTQLATGALTA